MRDKNNPLRATLQTALVWIAAASGAAAQEAVARPEQVGPAPRETVLEGDQAFAVALRLLIEADQYREALDLIDTRPDLAERPDVIRLRAQLLAQTGREREALALLESHLTRDGHDALARFQLAELHFNANRDGAATLAYQLAMAGDLDAPRAAISQARLAEIARRRQWRFWAGASAAPDSNINGATDASRVNLFGLPFELDDNARRRSGVSFSAFGGAERIFHNDGGVGFRASLLGSFTDAPGTHYDDAYLSLRLGPDWRIGRNGEFSIEATAGNRWFGGDPYETAFGAQVKTELSSDDQTRWAFAGRVEDADVRSSDTRDGQVYGLDFARTRFLGPSSLWRISGNFNYRDAKGDTETFAFGRLAAGRLFGLPVSTLVYVEPYISARRYDGVSGAFGVAREDFEYGVSSRFSKRDWIIAGAFPFVALSATRNDSNISLYEFSRERIEFGFTREF